MIDITKRISPSGAGRIQRATKGFTLIELLVVITIIGIIAAMVVSLSGHASASRRISLVKAELSKLEVLIENYHLTLGYYPLDNGQLVQKSPTDPASPTYSDLAGQNPLFYELTGPTYYETNQNYVLFDKSSVKLADIKTAFNIGGLRNASNPKSDSDTPAGKRFFNPPPKANQYKTTTLNGVDVNVFVVPVDLVPGQINAWKYDASSTNRHNPESFDIWADFSAGKNTVTLGNWKQ